MIPRNLTQEYNYQNVLRPGGNPAFKKPAIGGSIASGLVPALTPFAIRFGLPLLGVGAGFAAPAAVIAAGAIGIGQVFSGAYAASEGISTALRYAPRFLDQKLAPIRQMMNPRPSFGGDTLAAAYGATERSRAMSAIRMSHGVINDRRFVGAEARYYHQY